MELVVNVSFLFVLEHAVERCLSNVLHPLSHREVPMPLLLTELRGTLQKEVARCRVGVGRLMSSSATSPYSNRGTGVL